MARKEIQQEKRKKGSFVKEVAAQTFEDAFIKIDDMGASCFDMYVCKVEPYEERDGYIKITMYGWENDDTRELYSI